jgi:hypothetical protein
VARYFDVTTPVTSIALDASRTGEVAFTVSNATQAPIRAESNAVGGAGTQDAWFRVLDGERPYPVGGAEQVRVSVAVPATAAPGSYSFVLRTMLVRGVPEEDFDDSPEVRFEVAPGPVAPAPPKRFPWWIVLVVAAILAVIVLAGIAFVLSRPGPSPSPSPSPSPTPFHCQEPIDRSAPPNLPDLALLDVRPQPGAGGVRVEADIVNNGSAEAGPFLVRFRMDLQTIDFERPDGLLPGGQFTAGVQFNQPDYETASVTIDPQDCVFELDETNNTQAY